MFYDARKLGLPFLLLIQIKYPLLASLFGWFSKNELELKASQSRESVSVYLPKLLSMTQDGGYEA